MSALTPEQIAALPELVKPLEWVDLHKDGSCFVVCSDHPLGYSDSITRTSCGGWFFNGGLFPTLEDAKAAAQADYEARILSALNLPMLTALSEDASKAAELAVLLAAFDPRVIGSGPSTDMSALHDAQMAARAALGDQP